LKILITGGAGFIGSYFASSLVSGGHEVVSVDLAPPSQSVPGVDYRIGDIRDGGLVNDVTGGCDAILHLAAAHHDFGIDDATFQSVNVDGTRTVCESACQHQVHNICFFSTVAVYGSNCPPPVTEGSTPHPDTAYGTTKLAAETVLDQWSHGGEGRKCLIIRPTVTFGAENYANMFTLIRQIDSGRFLKVGSGTNYKSLCYVENIVSATLQLWLQSRPNPQPLEIFNYIDKPDLTSEQITNIIYDELDQKPPSFRVPYWLARLLATPFDLAIAMTGKNLPVSGARIKKLALSETKYEAEKIQEQGISSLIPLEQGIRKMVQWYLEKGRHVEDSAIRRSLPPPRPATRPSLASEA